MRSVHPEPERTRATFTRTTSTLLDDLGDPSNEAVWHAFDARYRPILVAFCGRLGLAPEDAADAAQEALCRFVKSYRLGRYDRGRGRLRSWMFAIARNCARDAWKERAARREQRGHSALADLPTDDDLARAWEQACDREILWQALSELRRTRTEERTVRAFRMLAFEGRTPADVAAELSMTANDVYLAKYRCLRRLRSIVASLTREYDLN